jgi:aspartyl/asparaginyl-tRNA synthetase
MRTSFLALAHKSIASQLLAHTSAGVSINVQGWISSPRRMKNFTFVHVNDGSLSGSNGLQAVIKNNHLDSDLAAKLAIGASVDFEGVLVENTRDASLELQVASIKILGECDRMYYPDSLEPTSSSDKSRPSSQKLRPTLSSPRTTPPQPSSASTPTYVPVSLETAPS